MLSIARFYYDGCMNMHCHCWRGESVWLSFSFVTVWACKKEV